jgi:hypothetical protein
MDQAGSSNDMLGMLYLRVRKAIGWIGVLLPFALYLGNRFVHPNFHPIWPDSMSGYYYTHMRNFFVGSLCALAVFFIAYSGHDKVDRWVTNIAGLFALGVAFFPTTPTRPPFYHGPPLPSNFQRDIGYVHTVFAAALLLTLALVALRFTKTEPGDKNGPFKELLGLVRKLWYSPADPEDRREPPKRNRDAVYRVCARLILVAVLLAVISNFLPKSITGGHALFFLEAAAVFCFGVSWFVKGQAILADSGQSVVSRVRGRLAGASAT